VFPCGMFWRKMLNTDVCLLFVATQKGAGEFGWYYCLINVLQSVRTSYFFH
jgi:hypothetical protein